MTTRAGIAPGPRDLYRNQPLVERAALLVEALERVLQSRVVAAGEDRVERRNDVRSRHVVVHACRRRIEERRDSVTAEGVQTTATGLMVLNPRAQLILP